MVRHTLYNPPVCTPIFNQLYIYRAFPFWALVRRLSSPHLWWPCKGGTLRLIDSFRGSHSCKKKNAIATDLHNDQSHDQIGKRNPVRGFGGPRKVASGTWSYCISPSPQQAQCKPHVVPHHPTVAPAADTDEFAKDGSGTGSPPFWAAVPPPELTGGELTTAPSASEALKSCAFGVRCWVRSWGSLKKSPMP